MTSRTSSWLMGGLLCALPLVCATPSRASDHADTVANAGRPGADMADVFIFPSPMDNSKVVLVMDVNPLIPAGQAASYSFDPNVLYQFKIDTSGDFVEDLVIQARFSGMGANQRVLISGPYKPLNTGTTATFARPYQTTGMLNNSFFPTPGMRVFAGPRSDPFFFDLAQFFAILPDRGTPAFMQPNPFTSVDDANTPQKDGFRGFSTGSANNMDQASDLLTNFSVLSIVVELPRTALINGGDGKIRLWETTSVLGGSGPRFQFNQQDRLARPAVNEALAPVALNRHAINNSVSPTGDADTIQQDILGFMAYPAGRSPEIAAALASVLVPDVMVADLTNMTDKASYLGVETGGFTGGKFGGRALADDVIDIDLMAIFGNVVPTLFPKIPDDGKELPYFITDNVGPHTDYSDTFPYLGAPR